MILTYKYGLTDRIEANLPQFLEVSLLPFLKKQKANNFGLIVKTRESDSGEDEQQPEDKTAAIEACAQDLIQAVHSRNVKMAAEAICSAFEILEGMEHSEASPHTYDAQTGE